MKMTDDTYLAKLKLSNIPDHAIAQKLGITVEEVEKRWLDLQEQIKQAKLNSYGLLVDQFTVMCYQYQVLGESLKIVGGALSNILTHQELVNCVTTDPQKTIENLKGLIILRPFVPADPEENLKQSVKGN